MGKTTITSVLLFVLLIFLQVWLFNKIHLFGLATPLLYIYFFIKLPVTMSRNWVLILAALMGFILDIFDYTLGMNMLALVIIGFLRQFILNIFAPRDIFENYQPSFSTFGNMLFLRYAATVILLYSLIFFSIDAANFFNPGRILLKAVSSSLLTLLLVYAFESLNINSLKQ
ncbi:MAG: rod shape-determining protein MreD [Dysgonamonadaceae bacterium]|jgi:rod shape-determining protein MreD|nr:rod shape-determining protein MreD [Dysgonamonadaceae bacterium]